MARTHCTVFSLLLPSKNPIVRRTYPLLVASSIPYSNPSKVRHRRKNHLRPKILKTLPKSHPSITPLLPPESPLSPSHIPEEDDFSLGVAADGIHPASIAAAATESGALEELQVSETTGTFGEFNSIAGKLSARSILKYSAFLFGAFVLRSIFSLWILLDDDSKLKAGNSEVNVRENRNSLFDGSGKYMRASNIGGKLYVEDQLERKKKIDEIKLMAREARRIEGVKKEEETEDPESGDESVISGHRLGIEKEIGARLLKLQDRVNSNKDESALSNVIKTLGNSINSSGGVAGDNKNAKKGNETIKFKKKLKYRSPSTKPTKTPKGFSGIRDHKASDAETRDSASNDTATAQENRSTGSDHVQVLYEDKQVNQQDFETQETYSRLSLEDRGKLVDKEANTLPDTGKNLEEQTARLNVETGTGVKIKRRSNGGFLEDGFGRTSIEGIQSKKSKDSRMQNKLGIIEENQDVNSIFEKDDVLRINSNPKHGIADNISAANRVKAKRANTETDMWWLKLRYVLVIIMRRGSDEEGPGGLYSLKITSQEEDQNDYSYIVAFEDQADANNFCFLLESFFEGLGDFSADAVPMSIQELRQAVESQAKKVVVVKKKQLQLFAGQPLSDVEMTLRTLVEQHQNVRLADSKEL